jgi:prophage antirepressor-like protein
MTDLTVFRYANTGAGVRTVVRDNEAWFVAADVCVILGLGRTHDAVRGLDEDEKGADTIRTPGGDLHDQADEPDDEPDEFERQLTEAFGPVQRWWIGEIPGLGPMRLPLP